jgi:hypothetical protein
LAIAATPECCGRHREVEEPPARAHPRNGHHGAAQHRPRQAGPRLPGACSLVDTDECHGLPRAVLNRHSEPRPSYLGATPRVGAGCFGLWRSCGACGALFGRRSKVAEALDEAFPYLTRVIARCGPQLGGSGNPQ